MHVDDSVKNRQQVLSTTLALYQMPESSLVSTRAPIWTSAQLMAHAPSTAARSAKIMARARPPTCCGVASVAPASALMYLRTVHHQQRSSCS